MSEAARQRLLPLATLGLVMLLWSGNAIVGRAVRDVIPPFTLAFWRWAGALVIVLPFALGHLRKDREGLRRHWRPVLLLGFTGVACFNAFMYSGLRYTTAANAMLLQAAIPALVLLFDKLFFKVRANLGQVAGVLLSVAGVVVIVGEGRADALLTLSFGLGEALILGGVVVWSLYTSLLKLRPAVHPMSFLAATFAIGAIAMLPLALHEWLNGMVIHWGPLAIGGLAYVAIFPSVVAYALYNAAVADIGAARAGQAITLLPLLGALLAAALLGEPLLGFHFAGMGLILLGIVVSTGRRAQAPLDQKTGS